MARSGHVCAPHLDVVTASVRSGGAKVSVGEGPEGQQIVSFNPTHLNDLVAGREPRIPADHFGWNGIATQIGWDDDSAVYQATHKARNGPFKHSKLAYSFVFELASFAKRVVESKLSDFLGGGIDCCPSQLWPQVFSI